MTAAQRGVVVEHGWEYFRMPAWQQAHHHEYPEHLRSQVTATAVSVQQHLPEGSGMVMSLISKALDARKRSMVFEL